MAGAGTVAVGMSSLVVDGSSYRHLARILTRSIPQSARRPVPRQGTCRGPDRRLPARHGQPPGLTARRPDPSSKGPKLWWVCSRVLAPAAPTGSRLQAVRDPPAIVDVASAEHVDASLWEVGLGLTQHGHQVEDEVVPVLSGQASPSLAGLMVVICPIDRLLMRRSRRSTPRLPSPTRVRSG